MRFACRGCGRCCKAHPPYGYIYLTLPDRRRLAAALGLRTATFTRQRCQQTEGLWHLSHPERDCQLLVGGRCSVYDARPGQCRTWPFWPENMTPRVWTREIAAYCPGIGHGRLHRADEILGLLASARCSAADR